MKINIEVSIGELVDKLSILEIKLEKIEDKEKILNIEKEYDLLIIEYRKILKAHSDIKNRFWKLKRLI